MLLTKLEVKGFKSFGDKITVHFDKGITGVVGPNGCGKSNIVDSIRWVLGEQKTSALRSEKMENIIFNGTKNRKQLQMAEASLTFKNTKNLIPTEYNEVTITRRYYRSGESEYQLNGVTCRLKDITNLFLDTGIGSDSYAIIELKMVDNILNDKDNSRRALFEEAAGISKFKVRKKQTLQKLKTTDKDLERVEDVLFEIEKNLKSLEKQAKQAEKYHNLKTEYKKHSIALAKLTLLSHNKKIEEIKEKIKLENDKKNKNTSLVAQINAQIESLKKGLLLKEELVSSRQKTLNDHVNKTRQYESDKKIKNERLRFLNERSSNLTEQLVVDKQNVGVFHDEIKKLEKEVEDIRLTILDQEKILEEHKALVDEHKEKINVTKTRLNLVNSKEKEVQENYYSLKKSIEVNEAQLISLKNELEKTNEVSGSYGENIINLETEQHSLAKKLNETTESLETLEKIEEGLEKNLVETDKKIVSIKESLVILNREIDAKQNEYNLTKSLVDNLEGFPAAIKFLKKNSQWSSDSPLLSDLITCEPAYRVAIENYLEPWMNYYVVSDVESAYRAISLLKESSKGKANFFILNDYKDISANKKIQLEHCLNSLEIIEFDQKYEQLITHLLGDVYLLTNDNANIPLNRPEVFISKDGSITKRKRTITGGSVGLFEGKRIGRAKNLDKLKKEIADLNTKRTKIQVDLDRVNNDLQRIKSESKKQEIELAKKNLSITNEKYISIKLRLEQTTTNISSNTEKKEDLAKNIEIVTDGINKNNPKLDLIKVELDKFDQEISELKKQLDTEAETGSKLSNEYNQENIRVHQNKNKLESFEREISFKNDTYKKTEERIEKGNQEIEKTDQEIKSLMDKSNIEDTDLLALYEEKENIEKGVNEAEKEYYAHRTDIENLEKNIKENNTHNSSTNELLLELNNHLNEVKLTMTSIKERMSAEFKIDLNQLSLSRDAEEENATEEATHKQYSESELNEKVLSFRKKIDNIGPINPMAMEAYNEIRERYDFIIAQRKDLSDAKKSLMETITEIDGVAKENFEQAFKDINTNFQKVFRSLFTEEDTCNLILSDEDNPLDSKIDIIAKPKGKRPLGINQLSGGEKTLTAVALLFAIYLIKPAPFCIFDEVDAPLDDANIDKFNNIIREFSKESQFILVTHNKRTMSTTDIMYGVTMQESGVSKLVPVDLRDFENEYES